MVVATKNYIPGINFLFLFCERAGRKPLSFALLAVCMSLSGCSHFNLKQNWNVFSWSEGDQSSSEVVVNVDEQNSDSQDISDDELLIASSNRFE